MASDYITDVYYYVALLNNLFNSKLTSLSLDTADVPHLTTLFHVEARSVKS